MAISLSNRQRWQLAAGFGLLVCVYLFLAGKEFAASVFASRPELPKLERAVLALAGKCGLSPSPRTLLCVCCRRSSVRHRQPSSRRRAQSPRCPLLVRSGRRLSGHRGYRGQRTALDRALQAEPTAPDVAWEAANFFLIDGEIDRALREFRVVIENDISLVDASLRACWRVRPDADALLRDVVPAAPRFPDCLSHIS